jgi:hypothetical protein
MDGFGMVTSGGKVTVKYPPIGMMCIGCSTIVYLVTSYARKLFGVTVTEVRLEGVATNAFVS